MKGRKERRKEGRMDGRNERTNEGTKEGRKKRTNERREGGREGGKNDKINIFGLICLLWLICLSSCGPRKYNCCSLIDFCAFQWVVMPATFSKLMQLPETFFYIILVILIKDDYRSLWTKDLRLKRTPLSISGVAFSKLNKGTGYPVRIIPKVHLHDTTCLLRF